MEYNNQQELLSSKPSIDLLSEKHVSEIILKLQSSHQIQVADIARLLGKKSEILTLPNGKIIDQITWKESDLPYVFQMVSEICQKSGLGKYDCITIDGSAPGRLVTTISHATHPVNSAISYPQGGKDARLPLSGSLIEGAGNAQDLVFEVKDCEKHNLVEFRISTEGGNIADVTKTLQTLQAPFVPHGKPVYISGRGPLAIAVNLAEAYAHLVPYVAMYQPGVGYVVAISHSDMQLGTILK